MAHSDPPNLKRRKLGCSSEAVQDIAGVASTSSAIINLSAAALEEIQEKRDQNSLEKAKLKDEKRQLALSALKEKRQLAQSASGARQFKEDLECNDLKVDGNVPQLNMESSSNIGCETIRQQILILENFLYERKLSFLHVRSRKAWRDALADKKYDKQCDRLVWGCQAKSDEQENPPCSIKSCGSEDAGSSNAEIHMAMKSPFSFADLSPSDPLIVKAYACAILQVEQGIPRKRLKSSFVAGTPTEEMSQLERWEMSLINCIDYSQLFDHVITLCDNIHWAKPARQAFCRACTRRCNNKKILCDECNREYHNTLKLDGDPCGDSYCSVCGNNTATLENRKQRIPISEEPEASGRFPLKSLKM